MPHTAKTFAELPNAGAAARLLARIADAPCSFSPARPDAPLALYGAGNLGRLARDFLKAVGHDFAFAIDRNAERVASDPGWAGTRIYRPDDVPDGDRRAVRLAVSVVLSPYVPIERALLAQGFKDVVPFFDLAENFRHVHPLSNGWFAAPLTDEDRANTENVLARWDDDISRAHHLMFLAWRRLREEWSFHKAPLPEGERFFIPEVARALNGAEVLLDGGAHHGSVIEAFARHAECKEAIAIEPDPDNRARLASARKGARVDVLDVALAESAGEAKFHAGLDYASQISETGTMDVRTQPLDALNASPTFVKLHLEGAELNALKGARQTLLAKRPIVAATIYHNADGIWRTPRWLMDTLPDYTFLFRAHAWCGNGAVVYCIPDERTP